MSNNYVKRYGKNNPMWKGDGVGYGALHRWVRRNMAKPRLCDICCDKPPIDLANISPTISKATYNRDLSNWQWLCRSCHMRKDGRIGNLKKGGRKVFYKSCFFCKSQHKAKGLCSKHYAHLRDFGVLYL